MTARTQGHLFRDRSRLQSEHSEFMKLSGVRYQDMASRFAERRDKRGRVTRLARDLLFSREEFRAWLIKLFGGTVEQVLHGTVRCEYCNWPVDIQRLQLDHRLPAQQGGSLCLSNLAPSCGSCNRQKGEMSAPAYQALMSLVDNDLREELRKLGQELHKFGVELRIELPLFSSIDRTDVLARLKRGHRERERQREESDGIATTGS